MYCIFAVLFTLALFVAIFVLSLGAKMLSRYYQKCTYGAVDEEVAVNWQNRVALLGIAYGFYNLFSRISFSVTTN